MHLLYLRAIIDVRGKSKSSKNSLLVAVCPRDKIGLSGWFRTYYPQSVVRTLINYFIFSIASCSPFACLSASCPSCSLDVARYAFKWKTGKMPTNKRKMNRKGWKQPKIFDRRFNDRLGFKQVTDKHR